MNAGFTQHWLTILCQAINGVHSALFILLNGDNQSVQVTAKWPADMTDVNDFAEIIKYAINKNEPLSIVNVQEPSKGHYDFFVQPVLFQTELLGTILVKVNHTPKEHHDATFKTLQQGVRWLELANTGQDKNPDSFAPAIALLSACLEQKSYREALISLVTELTQALNCEQVAVGEFENQHSKIVALSNSAHFDARSNFMQKIADAMDEAIEQDSLIVYPQPYANVMQRAHQELTRKFGAGCSLTIPLVNDEDFFGAITLLRREDKPFDPETVSLCQLSMSLLTPFLVLKKADERGILTKIKEAAQQSLGQIFGYENLKLKLTALGSISLIIASAFINGDFQLTADAVLEGNMQRVVAAPIEGYIVSASVRAGDTVRKGDLMATLDDSDLKLELNKLNGQLQKYRREYREALSVNDLVKVRVISAQIDQATAEMELTQQQLQKIALTAPFDSVVIEGDLSQMLGSPVERGDMLFKIAPMEGYRIILKVDDSLISYVKPGQKGLLALSSIPDRAFDLTVEKITAVAKAEDNSNIFRVEASLDKAPELLRPGMQGIGKINADRNSLLWIGTHKLINWLRLWLWSWWF